MSSILQLDRSRCRWAMQKRSIKKVLQRFQLPAAPCDVPDPAVQLSPVGERERDAAMRRSVLAEVQRCTAPHISDRHDITYGHRHSQSGNTVGLVPPPRTNHVSRAAGRGRRSPPGAVGRIPPGGRGRGAAAGRDAGPAGRAHNSSYYVL